jgi:hypothetical protein
MFRVHTAPAAQRGIVALLERGLHKPDEVENCPATTLVNFIDQSLRIASSDGLRATFFVVQL